MQNNAAAIGRQMVGNHPDGLAGNAALCTVRIFPPRSEAFLLLIEFDDPDASIQIALALLPGLEDATVAAL